MKTKPDIRVELSAPSQRQPAFSVRAAAPILKENGVRSVVDFGCGNLRNVPELQKHFKKVTLVETKTKCDILRDKTKLQLLTTSEFQNDTTIFDAIFFISVLHIIPEPEYRLRLVRMAARKLRDGGFMVVDCPLSETYYNRRRNELPKYNDGMLLAHGRYYTFYKNFVSKELDSLFTQAKGLQLFSKIAYTKHTIRIWRRGQG